MQTNSFEGLNLSPETIQHLTVLNGHWNAWTGRHLTVVELKEFIDAAAVAKAKEFITEHLMKHMGDHTNGLSVFQKVKADLDKLGSADAPAKKKNQQASI
jgi:hypothetical protein